MSNIWSIGDFCKKKENADRSTSSFTGGEHSGLAVENRQDPDGEWVGKISGPPPEGSRKVTVYRNGFTLEDGEFRSIDVPENKNFMDELKAGLAPKELQEGGKPVYVVLEDRRTVDYKDDSVKSAAAPAFSGTGNSLGDTATTAAGTVDASRASIQLNENGSFITLQLRFHDGTRVTQRFNEDSTILDLHTYFMEVAPVNGSYKLVEGFPPREVTSESNLKLKEAGLAQTTVTQVLL